MKRQPKRVLSDDCLVVDGTEPLALHEGEWVEVIPRVMVEDLRVLNQTTRMGDQVAAVKGDADEAVQVAGIVFDDFDAMADLLPGRILAWSWTDDRGQPYPQPSDDPSVFKRLDIQEVSYLWQVARGESPGERKNGSSGSPTSSSATAPPPSPTSSASARSRSKA